MSHRPIALSGNFSLRIAAQWFTRGCSLEICFPSFSDSVPGTVYAFEPVPENFLMAKLCVEENQLANVLLYNAALSNGYADLRINTKDPDNAHAGGASEIGETGIYCPTLPIDCLAATDIG